MPYATPSDVATYLQTTLTADQQTLVASLIAGAEDAINRATNRSWSNGAQQAEHFDGGHTRLFPKHVPIDTVTSLTDDDTALTEDDDFFVYDAYIALNYTPSRTRKRLSLVYTASDTVPDAIKQAVVRWVAEQFQNSKNAGQRISRLTQGPVTIEYGGRSGSLADEGALPGYVQEVIRLYRLPAV